MADADEQAIERAVAEAEASWPKLELGPELRASFVARVRACTEQVRLDRLHVADLFLAFACEHQVSHAAELFERSHGHELTRALAGLGDRSDDVAQAVRTKLLVASEGPAKIASYGGLGPLGAFVAVTARRAFLDARRRERVARERDAARPGPADDEDPELAWLEAHYREHFKAAFAEAVAELEHGERDLLRLHFVHRVPVQEVAEVLGIHRVTASRRLARARERLLAGCREGLARRLAIGDRECESIVRLLDSRLELSLSRVFGR